MSPRLAFLVLPYTRAELPRWDQVIESCGAGWDEGLHAQWRGLAKVVVRGKDHGFLMNLDLSDWSERKTYFLGRYYELGVIRVLDTLLRPGDRFVDIGTNIGMITLHARSLVGKTGRIDCFEPNPGCVAAIKDHLTLNCITNVVVHEFALAESAGLLSLKLTSEHSGTATLADVGSDAVREIAVQVRVGDEVLDGAPRLVKIDVEGFELQVLKGLRRTLSKHKPFVITELIDDQLRKAGTSVGETTNFLFDLGYLAYGIATRRRYLRQVLTLHHVSRGNAFAGFKDVLWAHQDNPADLKDLVTG